MSKKSGGSSIVARNEAVNRIDADVKAESDKQMKILHEAIERSAEAVTALSSQLEQNRIKVDQQLIEGQKRIQASIDEQVAKGIGAKAKSEAEAQVAKLRDEIAQSAASITALNTQLAQNGDKLERQLSEGQARLKTTIDNMINKATEATAKVEVVAKDEAATQLAKLRDTIDSSTASIAKLNAQVSANQSALSQEFTSGQAAIRTAIDTATTQGVSSTNAYLDSKRPLIDSSIEKAVNERVEGAKNVIQDALNIVEIRKKNFNDSLPENLIFGINRVTEFNTIVGRYSGRIEDVLGRLSMRGEISSSAAVANILGESVWFVLGAIAISLVSLVASALAFFRTRRPKE